MNKLYQNCWPYILILLHIKMLIFKTIKMRMASLLTDDRYIKRKSAENLLSYKRYDSYQLFTVKHKIKIWHQTIYFLCAIF